MVGGDHQPGMSISVPARPMGCVSLPEPQRSFRKAPWHPLSHRQRAMRVDVCERLDKGQLDSGSLLGDMDKNRYHYIELFP